MTLLRRRRPRPALILALITVLLPVLTSVRAVRAQTDDSAPVAQNATPQQGLEPEQTSEPDGVSAPDRAVESALEPEPAEESPSSASVGPEQAAPDASGDAVCPENSRALDGHCVRTDVACPEGFEMSSAGECEPDFTFWEARRHPTCATPLGAVDNDRVRIEVSAGYAFEGGVFLDGPTQGAGDRRNESMINVGLGLTHGSLSIRAVADLGLAGDGYDTRRVALELGARCACWSEFYQWRLGFLTGYDFGASGFVVGFLHRSIWRIVDGLLVGFELGLVGTVGALSENGYSAAGGRLGIFVGYAL